MFSILNGRTAVRPYKDNGTYTGTVTSDRHTWIAEIFPRQDGTAVRPLPFDRNYNPKLAGNAIARAIAF
jgi:GH35 family endo-1,4-beta-xylanase